MNNKVISNLKSIRDTIGEIFRVTEGLELAGDVLKEFFELVFAPLKELALPNILKNNGLFYCSLSCFFISIICLGMATIA